ncbi:MAG: HAMP domain-containing sensor histidine kinase [Gammaproteobacteria bacterium]|nr:HAMP domain-containing sensor histidine kinase [Gammaproteobacteria bacterium]
MTPDVVLQQYVEMAHAEPLDVDGLVSLVSADADLLGRWISMLHCPVSARALNRAMHDFDHMTLASLAQAQIWTVTPAAGCARLSFEPWCAVVESACLAEGLAGAIGMQDTASVRLQIILAVSGLMVDHDPLMRELAEFRGSRPELLADAHPTLRILAVVEAQQVNGETEASGVAEQLLGIDADTYSQSRRIAGVACEGLIAGLGIRPDVDADWAERMWLQQQILAFSNVIAQQPHAAGLSQAHRLITSELFNHVPKTFLLDTDRATLGVTGFLGVSSGDQGSHSATDKGSHYSSDQQAYHDEQLAAIAISLADSPSVVARSLRDRTVLQQTDDAAAAIVDRQLMRRFDADALLAVPMVVGELAIGVMVYGLGEDTGANEREAMAAYAHSVGRWLAAQHREQRAVEDFATTYRATHEKRLREIVHEASNPLSIVHNYLHILELRLQEDPSTVDQVRLIRDEISRTAVIIRRVVEFPEIEDEDGPSNVVNFPRTDLNGTIAKVCMLMEPHAQARGVRIEASVDDVPLTLETDSDRVTQVLTNLVKNAVEAMTNGAGNIAVASTGGVYRDGREGVEFTVSDNGPGLPGEVLAHLYQPTQTTKGGDHAGLGLHIVGQLVEDLEGSIDVRTAPGQGTAFTVFLPLAPA